LKVKAVAKEAEAKAKSAVGQGKEAASDVVTKKALTGGDQGFIGLVLDSVETYNHNTKKLRFKLPEEDQVSGLKVASALLTRYKGPEDKKATLRPYTPVSDESMFLDPDVRYSNWF
jgi:cytochrome-b5 reductase